VTGRVPEREGSESVDVERALRRARGLRLFEALERVYDQFPETQCDNCARCCFESPGVFFVEHLRLLEWVAQMDEPGRAAILRRATAELFFSWIDPGRACVFLESGRCTVYDLRPLACRLFGLVAPEDRDRAETEARLAARQEASRLRMLGIEVPKAVIERSLASCDRVRDRAGRPVRVDADALASRIARLDEQLIPRMTVLDEFCFRSFPERIGAASLGREVVDGRRLQLLRRAQRGEPMDDLVESAAQEIAQARVLPRRKVGR